MLASNAQGFQYIPELVALSTQEPPAPEDDVTLDPSRRAALRAAEARAAGPLPAPTVAAKKDPLKDPTVNPDPKNEFAPNDSYKTIDGVATVKGAGDAHAVDPSDVKQGSLGDCYFVAQLAATARTDPDRIANLIKDNGDGTYTVTLHLRDAQGKRSPKEIVVDSQFPQKGAAKTGDVGADGKPELWPMLIEKAFAKFSGGYEQIRGKKTKDSDVFAMLSGKSSSNLTPSSLAGDALLTKLEKALSDGHAVSFGAKSSTDDTFISAMKAAGVVGNHAYSLESVDRAGKTVNLRNPWGVQHLPKLTVENLQKFYDTCKIAAE